MMAFFNLTQLGTQNLFQTARSSENPSDVSIQKGSTPVREVSVKAPTEHGISNVDPSTSACTCDVAGSSPSHRTETEQHYSISHTATYSPCKTTLEQHSGSHTKYTELLRTHQRSPKGPIDLYRQPLTTTQMYGWWLSHGEPHKQDWAQGPKHVHVNSEMTRFVDEMSQTNKEFTLY